MWKFYRRYFWISTVWTGVRTFLARYFSFPPYAAKKIMFGETRSPLRSMCPPLDWRLKFFGRRSIRISRPEGCYRADAQKLCELSIDEQLVLYIWRVRRSSGAKLHEVIAVRSTKYSWSARGYEPTSFPGAPWMVLPVRAPLVFSSVRLPFPRRAPIVSLVVGHYWFAIATYPTRENYEIVSCGESRSRCGHSGSYHMLRGGLLRSTDKALSDEYLPLSSPAISIIFFFHMLWRVFHVFVALKLFHLPPCRRLY